MSTTKKKELGLSKAGQSPKRTYNRKPKNLEPLIGVETGPAGSLENSKKPLRKKTFKNVTTEIEKPTRLSFHNKGKNPRRFDKKKKP